MELAVYLVMSLLALGGSAYLYSAWQRRQSSVRRDVGIEPYLMAYMFSGLQAACNSVVAKLIQSKSLALQENKIVCGSEPLSSGDAFEKKIHKSIQEDWVVRDLHLAVQSIEPELTRSLERQGLLGSTDDLSQVQSRVGFPMALVLAVGFTRVGYCLYQNSPIGPLGVLVLLNGLAWMGLRKAIAGQNRQARGLKEQLVKDNEALRSRARGNASRLSPREAGLAVALFGTGGLLGGSLGVLDNMLRAPVGENLVWETGESSDFMRADD